MWLEELLRKLRAAQVKKYISPSAVVLDIGCGQKAFFLRLIKKDIKRGVGLDQRIISFSEDNLEIIQNQLQKRIDFPSDHFHLITLLAVLEHLKYPEDILKDSYRILKSGGKIIITTPSPLSKNVLEFLAFKLGILSREEIGSHLHYFSLKELRNILVQLGFEIIKAGYFEFGFNIFIVAQK